MRHKPIVTTTIARTFSPAEPTTGSQKGSVSKPLSAFFAESALVILGEPGAGKTTAFQDAANTETNAVFVSVRDFLALSPTRWAGKTLYLDGLDELRVKSADGASVLDQLRGRLDDMGRPRFRLSCRAADWYGSSDVARLRVVAPDEQVTVLRIDPLTEGDVLAIAASLISDPKQFLADAATHDVEELLSNPLTLKMLLHVVQDGLWPATRTDLFRRATEILALERNEEHARFQGKTVRVGDIIRAAQTICGVLLCGGVKGIALTQTAAAPDYPFLGDVPAPNDSLAIAARSRVFISDGYERARPVHRTVAEFLGASDLAARVRGGLPLERTLAVLTGYDGRPVADLRGVFAWLACLANEHAPTMIGRDPLGVILYGDAASLPRNDRYLLLRLLGELATQDPWFRAGNWNAPAFGGLASPDMAEVFKTTLEDPKAPLTFVASVLEAIRYGRPLRQLREPLLRVVTDATRDASLRVEALHGLLRMVPGDTTFFISLLEDVHRGTIADDDRRLRGILLGTFYPTAIPPAQIAQYLVSPSRSVIGEYTMFVEYELLAVTPSEAIPTVLDGMARRGPLRRGEDFSRLTGELLVRGLREHGEASSVTRLWSWLGIALGEHQEPKLGKEYQDAIREWFNARPMRIHDLYTYWCSRTSVSELWQEDWTFWRRVHLRPGAEHGRWLLDAAAKEPDENRADFLFRQAVRYLMSDDPLPESTLDELFAYAEEHARFSAALQEELRCPISDWRVKEAERRDRNRRRESEARALNVGRLSGMGSAIEDGGAIGALSQLAQVFFALFADVDREMSPVERVGAFAGEENAVRTLAGFVAVLHRDDLPTPEMIGRLHARSRFYGVGYAVLAGCDLVAASSMAAFNELPPSTLRSALAFHLTNVTGTSRTWIASLKREQPELAAGALLEFWTPQLENSVSSIPGLHELSALDDAEVARRVVLHLLRGFPACREPSARLLLAAALRHCEREAVATVCAEALRRRGLKGDARLLWLATAFALDLGQQEHRVVKALRGKREPARAFVGFLSSRESGGHLLRRLTVPARRLLLHLLIPLFPPRELQSGWHRTESDWDMSQAVRGLIDGLCGDVTAAAGQALGEMVTDMALAAWRDAIAHAIRVQAANRREAEFRYAAIEAVIQTLRGGKPANPADLQALVASELRVTAEDIRHGVTDGWKAFWNVDRHGRATNPRPEDDCRDRLLERLRPRLFENEVTLEPEGRYAEEKRADIKAIASALNIPVEIKRHYHRELWTAPEGQLGRLYTRDPASEGVGIFLVLWFGTDVAAVTKPPSGTSQPETAAELVAALEQLIPAGQKDLIKVIVIDCSRPLRQPAQDAE